MDKFVGKIVDPISGVIYALFRVVSGALMAQHGMQKVFGWLGGYRGTPGATVDFSAQPQIWIGGWIELVGGLMVALGLFTRSAAFIVAGTMAVAYFQFHQPGGTLPIQNKGETAVLFCWMFLLIAVRGTGQWGLTGTSKK